MSKFLFVVPPFTGHINPTLGLGAGLIKNGHQVAWVSFDPALKERIPDKGEFLLIEINISEAEKNAIEFKLRELSKKAVYGLESLKFLYEDVLVPINTGIVEGLRNIVDTYHPDIILNDQQMFSAAAVAVQNKIPYATSVTAPAAIQAENALPGVHKWESDQIIRFQKSLGIPEETRLDCSRRLSLIYTSKAFFGNSELPDYFQFVGPVINRTDVCNDFNWEQFKIKTDQPKILVSIGTTFDHEQKKQFFHKVTEAFRDKNILVIIVSDPGIFDEIPENFHIFSRIPQLELLPYMDAVVCHGGNNTVCETLSNAKPLVIIPIAYDQSYVASCVTNQHCGIRLNFNRFRANHLEEAVFTVLEDKEYVRNAKIIQESFIEAGGLPKAVSLLESLLTKNK